ncbi:MAG: right-handed parallel beta-helix repeat-containing protein [Myxococcales bacterium]|nr:right-handed parallel beta-helix repeat-containing protein [Myxococcales bacterium]MCB9754814.1 right-handed parallel beta-helix repeat-containing protein [Myxococcales bacterium]
MSLRTRPLAAIAAERPASSLLTALLGCALALSACGEPGVTTTASTTDACSPGEAGCECLDGGGCGSDDLVCAQGVCVDVDSESSSTTEGPMTDPSGSTSSVSETTTGDAADCSPADGSLNAACESMDASQPYCGASGECVDCVELTSCSSVSEQTPVCSSTGRCVECSDDNPDACPPERPVCDAAAETCESCDEHADCPESACDFQSGACFPLEGVVWVDEGNPSCSNEQGTPNKPFCTLAHALAVVDGPTTIMVHGGEYVGPLEVGSTKNVAIRAVEGSGEVIIKSAMGTALTIAPGSSVAIEGVSIAQSTDGLACSLSTLRLDRVRVIENGTTGLVLSSCTTVMRESLVFFNGSSGMIVTGGKLDIVNTFISDNSVIDIAGGAGIVASGVADISILYSTLFGNAGTAGGPGSIICSGDPQPQVELRNSVIYGASPDSMQLDACQVTTASCAYDYELVAPEITNDLIIQLSMNNVESYVVTTGPDAQAGLYRPQPGDGNGLRTLGVWLEGDPELDYDGDPRPDVADELDYAGADRIP